MSTTSNEFRWSAKERESLRQDFRSSNVFRESRYVRNYRDRREIIGTFALKRDVIEDVGPMAHPLD